MRNPKTKQNKNTHVENTDVVNLYQTSYKHFTQINSLKPCNSLILSTLFWCGY